MQKTTAEDRFFQSTRGRIVSLLRKEPQTVEKLADALALTGNGVRVHLTSLERDGLVTQGTPRYTGGKPAATYQLTPQADRLFPKAYGTLLHHLLRVLGDKVPVETMQSALIEVGHRLAASQPSAGDSFEARVNTAVTTLNDFGGLAEVVENDGRTIIQGYSCPLADAVEGDPDSCLLAETLLTDIIGVPVRQACVHTSPPRCRFEVHTATREGDLPDS